MVVLNSRLSALPTVAYHSHLVSHLATLSFLSGSATAEPAVHHAPCAWFLLAFPRTHVLGTRKLEHGMLGGLEPVSPDLTSRSLGSPVYWSVVCCDRPAWSAAAPHPILPVLCLRAGSWGCHPTSCCSFPRLCSLAGDMGWSDSDSPPISGRGLPWAGTGRPGPYVSALVARSNRMHTGPRPGPLWGPTHLE